MKTELDLTQQNPFAPPDLCSCGAFPADLGRCHTLHFRGDIRIQQQGSALILYPSREKLEASTRQEVPLPDGIILHFSCNTPQDYFLWEVTNWLRKLQLGSAVCFPSIAHASLLPSLASSPIISFQAFPPGWLLSSHLHTHPSSCNALPPFFFQFSCYLSFSKLIKTAAISLSHIFPEREGGAGVGEGRGRRGGERKRWSGCYLLIN